jgi:pimeloyl-ACP methyl ester carboxylesterase
MPASRGIPPNNEGDNAVTRLIICFVLGAFLSQPLLAQESPSPGSLKPIRVNGVELHYLDQGTGVPVIFVHGGLEDYRAWLPQMGAFSEHYRTIAYSRRHNYPNSSVKLGTDYSAIVDAEDLAALIQTLKLGPAHIVGVSYGAYVALFLAARHPRLVRSLVLSEPPILRWLPELEGGKPLYIDLMTKLWEPTTRSFREGDEAGVKAAIDGFGELGYSGTSEKMTFATLPRDVQMLLLSNATEWRALTMSKDAFPELPFNTVRQIKAPTLLLSGQRSLALHAAIDRQLQSLLIQNERIVLENATHEMWNEYPEVCRKATLVFLARH